MSTCPSFSSEHPIFDRTAGCMQKKFGLRGRLLIFCVEFVKGNLYVNDIFSGKYCLIPRRLKNQREQLVHTVCACATLQVFLGNLETCVKSTALH